METRLSTSRLPAPIRNLWSLPALYDQEQISFGGAHISAELVKRAHNMTTPKRAKERDAKARGVAKARRLSPELIVRLGSTPRTSFRGNPDIFGRLVEDHDRHRALLAMIQETQGRSEQRETLFLELTRELKAHAAAEEQALWSSVLRDPKTTDDARHAIAEHKEIDDFLADLAARDMASSAWLRRFAKLKEKYLHHIREEEQEQFVGAEKRLSAGDLRHLRAVFAERKRQEKAEVEIKRKRKPSLY